MVTRHGAARLDRRRHHATNVEALTVAVVRRIAEHALHEEVAVLDELTHLGLCVALGQDNDVDGLGDVFVANPGLIDGQVQVVVVADEIIVRIDRDAQPLHQLAFPGLVANGDVDLHLGERHDDRLVEGLGDDFGLVGGLPLAIKVLVALGEQQMVGACLKHLDDVAAKLQVVDEVGLGAAPVRLADEFLEGDGGRVVVAGEAIVHTQRGFGEVIVELGAGHQRHEGQKEKDAFFHGRIFSTKIHNF